MHDMQQSHKSPRSAKSSQWQLVKALTPSACLVGDLNALANQTSMSLAIRAVGDDYAFLVFQEDRDVKREFQKVI